MIGKQDGFVCTTVCPSPLGSSGRAGSASQPDPDRVGVIACGKKKMSQSNECSVSSCLHSQGISRDRIRYLFKQHWTVSDSQQGVVAPKVPEVTHYFGTRPFSWMGPLVTERRMSPSRNSISIPNQVVVECEISETSCLTNQPDRPVSRGSRAEYLYKQHWLNSKETGQKHDDTQLHNGDSNEFKAALGASSCGPIIVKKSRSLQAISEDELIELAPKNLKEKDLLEPKDSMSASSSSLLADEVKPQSVGQRLSELASKSIIMEADLVLLAEHGKVRYLEFECI